MNYDLVGKKILILGGAFQHIKLVNAARQMGVYTIVADYLNDSPSKKFADKSYLCDIKNIEQLKEICINEKVQGVISSHLDPCQIPYVTLCSELKLPCLANKEQFVCMTNKAAFKKMCIKNGVDIISEYSEDEVKNQKIEFPVFVKPVDSRGSRGQTVCYTYDSLNKAIIKAKKESSNNNVIIEKYIQNAQEFQVTYFFVNGEGYLVRTADSYTGSEINNLSKVVVCAISPSLNTEKYIKTAHNSVLNMLKNLGIKNGPVFMQGFIDNGVFRFFDPGLRFPGVNYEDIYEYVFGINLEKLLIRYALTGIMPEVKLPQNSVFLNGKKVSILFPLLKSGKINNITGVDILKQEKGIFSISQRISISDVIPASYDILQRFGEIDILADDISQIINNIELVYKTLNVTDVLNKNMIFDKFNTKRLKKYDQNN
ncbi:ATP-grasp domain-containing protein [bacterium]|nr:ATP-grasp domain-containing protein [bacterium]